MLSGNSRKLQTVAVEATAIARAAVYADMPPGNDPLGRRAVGKKICQPDHSDARPPMLRIHHSVLTFILIALALTNPGEIRAQSTGTGYGLPVRITPRAYLQMPRGADGNFPALLSRTGAFADTRNLIPAGGLIPYDIVVAFWSDGAVKSRWIAVPKGKIQFRPSGEWRFPKGTVFVKTFELPTDASNPGVKRRLETRLLVCDAVGGVYGAVYKWRPDNSDADLLSASLTEQIPIRTASGEVHQQTWYYPSRKDCLSCHTPQAGGVLGVKTRQLNRSLSYPSGVSDNELRTWNHIGMLAPAFRDQDLAGFPVLAAADDVTRSLEDRARSYLDANCAQCHRPAGTVAYFDARFDTPLAQQGLINGPVLIDQGVDRPRVISPHDIWRSIAFMRMNTIGDIRMPPIARETIDQGGVALLRQWILSLPGRSVLDPPVITPEGGAYTGPLQVSLRDDDPDAEIRYTLDGSAPDLSDLHYQGPIDLTGPVVLRARAFKDGFTRSITAQEVFIVNK